MTHLVTFALFGLLAQLVDGTLGMAYGVTSTTLLLAAGTSPAVASASVHFAEIGTSLISGVSHWKFRNVDWRIVGRLAIPGGVGAFVGATVLTELSTDAAAPWMGGILLALGVYILLRFTFRPPRSRGQRTTPRHRYLAPLGLFAGFVDATGGGGWGPVATPALLGSGRVEPRKVIGSVDTSEFVVALSASTGFLLALGDEGINWVTVAGLLIGGALAAPLAAFLVSRVPVRMLGSLVGGVVIVTNSRTLLNEAGVHGGSRWVVYVVLYVLWAAAVAWSARGYLRERSAGGTPEPDAEGVADGTPGASPDGAAARPGPDPRPAPATAAAASADEGEQR